MSPSRCEDKLPDTFRALDLNDQLWKLSVILKGLLKLDQQTRVKKFRMMSQVLRSYKEKNTKVPLGGLEQIMSEISRCLPYAEKLGRLVKSLAEIAGLVATLAMAHMQAEISEGSVWDDNAAQWVVEKFVQEPLKFAQKRAGGANLAFPVIHSVALAFADWPDIPGVNQAAKYCTKTIMRIVEQDRLVSQAKEGFGVIGACLGILGEHARLEFLEKMLDWAIEAINKSPSWETRYWAISFLSSVTQLQFSPIDDIALVLKGKERTIHQSLSRAERDSNLRVRSIAESVYEAYKHLWTRYIPSVSPTPEQTVPDYNQTGLPTLPENIPEISGDLPPEFYANLYRGNVTSPTEDVRMPNKWDIEALHKHKVWDKEPKFNPYGYDWTRWMWPLDPELEKIITAFKSGDEDFLEQENCKSEFL